MRKIWNVTKLDFSLIKPYLKPILFVILFPIVFVALNRSLAVGISFAVYFVDVTTSYTFTVTEKNGMERMYGLLPVTKREAVMGRYLLIGIQGLIALAVSIIAQPLVLRALGQTVLPVDILMAAMGGMFLFALYTAFQIPAYYKFGPIKGSWFLYVPGIISLSLLWFLPEEWISNPIAGANLPALLFLLVVELALIALMYAVSIWCSVGILEKKEF